MVIPNYRSLGYLKKRPTFTKGDMAGMGGNAGFVLAAKPKKYPKTAQQKRIGDAARECGIKRGISRAALITAMTDCIPGKFR